VIPSVLTVCENGMGMPAILGGATVSKQAFEHAQLTSHKTSQRRNVSNVAYMQTEQS